MYSPIAHPHCRPPRLWKPSVSPQIVTECPRAVVMYLSLLKLRLGPALASGPAVAGAAATGAAATSVSEETDVAEHAHAVLRRSEVCADSF